MIWLLIVLGAAIGAPARYLLDSAIGARRTTALPVGTLSINVLGSAALGALAAASGQRGALYAVLGTGFCGAFTTFSTFAWESLALAEDEAPRPCLTNITATLVLGLTAASLTYWLV